MVETPTSSASSTTSSCASFGSLDDVTVKTVNAVKFVCSYGGKILPRYPDGKLRYFGGETRVLSVDRSIPFSVLIAKMGELCGTSAVSLRCQLPAEDLDALVSVTSDEDLANLIEEYDLASRGKSDRLKIRAFLYQQPASKPTSPSSLKASSPPRISSSLKGKSKGNCYFHQISAPSRFSGRFTSNPRFGGVGAGGYHHRCLVHHGNHHWH